MVASVDDANPEDAVREIRHYAVVYGQAIKASDDDAGWKALCASLSENYPVQ